MGGGYLLIGGITLLLIFCTYDCVSIIHTDITAEPDNTNISLVCSSFDNMTQTQFYASEITNYNRSC